MGSKNNKPDSYGEFRKKVIKESKKKSNSKNNTLKSSAETNKKQQLSQQKVKPANIKNNTVKNDNKSSVYKEKSKLNIKADNQINLFTKNNVNREAEKQKIKNKNEAAAKRKRLQLSSIDIERKKFKNKKIKASKGLITHKKRKRQIKNFIVFVLTIAIIFCIGIVIKMFFNVEEIIVEGQTRYNTNKIVSMCGINIGENIFFCNSSDGANEIQSVMPYIDNVKIKRKLPNKIVIDVSETTAQYAVEYESDYLLISPKGKILERTSEKPKNLLILRGLSIETAELSATLNQVDENAKNALKTIMDSIDKNNLNEITMIDLKLLSNIRVYYQNRVAIIIGIPQNVDYKLRNAYNIIQTRLSDNVEGILDVSISDSDYKTSYFTEQSLASIFGNNKNPSVTNNNTSSNNLNDVESNVNNSENPKDTTTSIEPDNSNTSSENLPDDDRYNESEYYSINGT